MQLLSDKQLIELYQTGNEACFEMLLSRYQKRIFSSIYLLVKDEALANDIFQDTFIKVIDKLKANKYIDKGMFGAWVGRIAHNLCMDYFRANQQMSLVHSTDERDVFRGVKMFDGNQEDEIVTQETKRKLKLLIDLLPPDQKEVLLMRHFGNLSFKQIAELTDTNLNSCLGKMRYALKNLRKIMAEKNCYDVTQYF